MKTIPRWIVCSCENAGQEGVEAYRIKAKRTGIWYFREETGIQMLFMLF